MGARPQPAEGDSKRSDDAADLPSSTGPRGDGSTELGAPAHPRLDSIDAERLERRLRATLFGEPTPSTWIDRFELETKLGAGGMGSVWAAHDHRLGRRVALKFLRSHEDGSVGEVRLFREAQALARLAHPNVITVFDVGRHAGRVWIAMESVPGRTLRAWAAEPRSTRAILDAWIDAGRGLAAIHAAGLIHRDVKPDNVLLGDDGRVRVIDLGLVRALDELARPSASPTSGSDLGLAGTSSAKLGSTRERVGTPAYAAPEQLDGRAPLDARADQYAYCVSVWEALVGERPPAELAARRPGELVPLPRASERSMPTRIRRVLSRGLSHDPAGRFVDMPALLAELAPPRRAWILPSVLGVGLVAALTAGFLGAFEDPVAPAANPCAGASGPVDALWTAERRTGTSASLDPAAASLALGIVDAWTERWRDAAGQACAEVHVERLRSEDSLDRRRACLDDRLVELEVFLSTLDGASREPLAARAALLEDPRGCLRPQRLAAEGPQMDPQQRERDRELRARLFALELDREQLALAPRRRAIEAIHDQAQASGLTELQARAAQRLGALAILADEAELARTWFGRALDLGEPLHDAAIEVAAWHGLGVLALDLELDLDATRWAAEREDHALRELAATDPRHARALLLRARTFLATGALGEAETRARRAIDALAAAGPEAGWDHAAALRVLALIVSRQGRSDEAARLLEQARALEQGPASQPSAIVARDAALHAEGVGALEAGELDEAERLLDAALAAQVAQEGPRGRGVADILLTLTALADARGEPGTAREHAERADAIYTATSEPRDFDRYYALTALGTVAFRERRFADASRAYGRALDIAEHHLEPGAPDLALAHGNLGEALVAEGHPRRAEPHLRAGLAGLIAALGPESPEVAVASKGLATALLAQGDARGARELLERSLAIHRSHAGLPLERAETTRALARTLADLGEPALAREQAQAAIAQYEALGPDWTVEVAAITAWLADPATLGAH
jgi:tetratricopeptide (TPR) repeat protein